MGQALISIDELLGVRQSPERQARNRKRPIPLKAAPLHKRRPLRRLYVNAMRARNAAETLTGLPSDGETWHVVMTGNFDSFDLIDAMLHHAAPATIEALHLATLGFNHANATRLIAMMDAGTVKRCTMIVSAYYEADVKERDTCARIARELSARGGWYCAARSHAKVIAARFTDGSAYVIESSANLRTCHNLEQLTITNDADLFDFHAGWMETVHETEAQRAR